MGRYPQQTIIFRLIEGVNVKKFSCMLEHPSIQIYEARRGARNNDFGADNQQATFSEHI